MYQKEFNKLFELAETKVDDIEIMLSSGKAFSVRISKQEVEAFNYSDSKGIGVRISKNGKVGYAYTEEFSDAAFAVIIDEALANAVNTESEEPVVFSNYPANRFDIETYSDSFANISIEAKIAMAKKMEAAAMEADKRVFIVPHASYSDGESFIKIANSKGLKKEHRSNYCSASVMVLAQEDGDKKSGMDFKITRNFQEIDVEQLAKNAVGKAVELLNAGAVESGQYPVVMNNEMAANMLSTFSGIFSAKNVQDGKSALKGKIGSMIASPLVTIVDDGLHPEGLATSPFDSEGVPCQRTVLVDKGVLTGFLHNSTTAFKDNAKSTGNGSRGYKSPLSVSTSNFLLEPTDTNVNQLFQDQKKVVEIVSLQGLHSGANPVSGDFSLGAEGFLYENGVKSKSIANFTVSGNFFDLLKNITKIADDFQFNYNYSGSSSILIENLSISS